MLVFFLMNGKMQESRLFLRKPGRMSDLSNYRSIIPVVVRIFERIIYDQLYHYLNENNVLSRHQSGFHSLHCTVTALIEATDNCFLIILLKYPIVALLMPLSF